MTSIWRSTRLLYGRWCRLVRWEYWSTAPLYVPITPVLLWNVLKHRSLMIVTAANPGMPSGGFVEDSKSDILTHLLPSGRVAQFQLLPPRSSAADLDRVHSDLGRTFPIVLKPDFGERGRGVLIAKSREQALAYLTETSLPTIVQAYIPGVEYGVFYERHPDEARGRVTGITLKSSTTVTGDGQSSLEMLILSDPRAVCLAPLFLKMHSESIDSIPPAGKVVTLNQLGTHSQGSLFLDASHLLTPALEDAIDAASQHFSGFFIGRYDIRVPDEAHFRAGTDWHIVELNGVTSEPTHMYDPRHSVLYAWRSLAAQWTRAFNYAAANVRRGYHPLTFTNLINRLRDHRERLSSTLSSPSEK